MRRLGCLGGDNLYRWGSEESTPASIPYTELLAEMDSELDVGRLTSAMSEAEQVLADDLVFIPLFIRPTFVAKADCFINIAGSASLLEPSMYWHMTEDCR